MHFTPVGGNVFVDLGFEPKEAAALKAESQRIISEKLSTKGSLMTELAGCVSFHDAEGNPPRARESTEP